METSKLHSFKNSLRPLPRKTRTILRPLPKSIRNKDMFFNFFHNHVILNNAFSLDKYDVCVFVVNVLQNLDNVLYNNMSPKDYDSTDTQNNVIDIWHIVTRGMNSIIKQNMVNEIKDIMVTDIEKGVNNLNQDIVLYVNNICIMKLAIYILQNITSDKGIQENILLIINKLNDKIYSQERMKNILKELIVKYLIQYMNCNNIKKNKLKRQLVPFPPFTPFKEKYLSVVEKQLHSDKRLQIIKTLLHYYKDSLYKTLIKLLEIKNEDLLKHLYKHFNVHNQNDIKTFNQTLEESLKIVSSCKDLDSLERFYETFKDSLYNAYECHSKELKFWYQDKGTCWFNAILMCVFYSRYSRNLIIKKKPYWMKKKHHIFNIFGDLFISYKDGSFFRKYDSEYILKQLYEYDSTVFAYHINMLDKHGFNEEYYIKPFFELFDVSCIVFDKFVSDDRFYYSYMNNKISIDIENKTVHIYGVSANDIENALKTVPDVLVINYDLVPNELDETYYMKQDSKFVHFNINDTIQYNNATYVLDSVTLENANITSDQHIIAGITCGNSRYVYNGWIQSKSSASNAPCPLFKYNWDIKIQHDFCIRKNDCSLPDYDQCDIDDSIENMRFNFGEGNRTLIYIKV